MLQFLRRFHTKGCIADCECGYSINSGNENYTVFTDVLETDFTRQKNIQFDPDWVPQEWKTPRNASVGPYGRHTRVKNLVSVPVVKGTTKGPKGVSPGLQLWVNKLADETQEFVGVAEVDTFRTDILYGSFRAAMQLTSVNGTCGAFFWLVNRLL